MFTYVITIGREFGSSGCEIGEKLAEKLNIPYYDREILEKAAQNTGIQISEAENAEQNIYEREKNIFKKLGYSDQYSNQKLITSQTEVIRNIATKESCIIAGRCADYILKEYKYLMSVFVYSPLETRIQHIMDTYQLPRKSVENMISEIDRQRHYYYKYVTGHNWGDRAYHQIMVDSSFLGVDATVNLLYNMAIQKFPFASDVLDK